jgi:hypothetical protein
VRLPRSLRQLPRYVRGGLSGHTPSPRLSPPAAFRQHEGIGFGRPQRCAISLTGWIGCRTREGWRPHARAGADCHHRRRARGARRMNWHGRCMLFRRLCRPLPAADLASGPGRSFKRSFGRLGPAHILGTGAEAARAIFASHNQASDADDYRRARLRCRFACRGGYGGFGDAPRVTSPPARASGRGRPLDRPVCLSKWHAMRA